MVYKIGAQTVLGFFCQSQVSSALDSVQGTFLVWERKERGSLMRLSLPQVRRERLDAGNTLLLQSPALQPCVESTGSGQVEKIP